MLGANYLKYQLSRLQSMSANRENNSPPYITRIPSLYTHTIIAFILVAMQQVPAELQISSQISKGVPDGAIGVFPITPALEAPELSNLMAFNNFWLLASHVACCRPMLPAGLLSMWR